MKPVRIFRGRGKPDDGIENSQRSIPVSEQAWKLGDLFYLDAPTLERFFDRTTGYSPLGPLFEIYREDFVADHNQYSPEGGVTVRSREAFQQVSSTLADILRTPKLSEIEQALSSRVAEYLGGPARRSMRIEFSLPSHRELFEPWVGLQVSEHSALPVLPVECLGSGYHIAGIDEGRRWGKPFVRYCLVDGRGYRHIPHRRFRRLDMGNDMGRRVIAGLRQMHRVPCPGDTAFMAKVGVRVIRSA